MPVEASIKVYRGEDITLPFTMTPGRDITGWVISMTVSKTKNNSQKVLQATATITSGPNGTFEVILTSTQLNLEPGTYYYDVFRVSPGNFRILNVGEFIVGPDARFPS